MTQHVSLLAVTLLVKLVKALLNLVHHALQIVQPHYFYINSVAMLHVQKVHILTNWYALKYRQLLYTFPVLS